MKKTVLCVGYFVGELGWYLMKWQGTIRHIAKNYDFVIYGCEKGYEYFVSDFVDKVVFFGGNVDYRNMWMANGQVYDIGEEIKEKYSPDSIITPDKRFCRSFYHQDYISYGKKKVFEVPIILFHARGTKNFSTQYRNWPLEKWSRLVDFVAAMYNGRCRIFSIGSVDGAYHVPNTEDARGVAFSCLCDMMASAECTVGPSSGPMHLAALCKCPHFVWTHDKRELDVGSNKNRYEKAWNPFKTEVKVIEHSTWDVPYNKITDEIRSWLSR